MMASAKPLQQKINLHLADETASAQFAQDLALALNGGEAIALIGDLGAGKSTIARAIIRHLSDDATLEVPSPTFTLVQEYELAGRLEQVRHFDLYRLAGSDDLHELGFFDMPEKGITLVEWPERADDAMPDNSILLRLTFPKEGGRDVEIEGEAVGIERSIEIRNFLNVTWQEGVQRRFMFGDASTRSYETTELGNKTRILMNAPAMPDGPPIKDGKPYSQIAHLAEDVRAFVGIGTLLAEHGFAAPNIFGVDFDRGLMLIEHLGSDLIVEDGAPITERYLASAETLAEMHRVSWPPNISLSNGDVHQIPDFDRDAMLIEVELLTDWYAPFALRKPLGEMDRQAFVDIWSKLIARVQSHETSLLLRDYHSPNIIWRGNEQGVARTGIIDFQDAMIGPVSYDLASLAQDARVTIPAATEQEIVEHYIQCRSSVDDNFEADALLESYAIMAAQRATKVLGIFVRLNERDGKPAYLAHLPRLHDYLKRVLPHPVLSELREWYARVLNLKI